MIEFGVSLTHSPDSIIAPYQSLLENEDSFVQLIFFLSSNHAAQELRNDEVL